MTKRWNPVEGIRPAEGLEGPAPPPLIRQVIAPPSTAALYRILSHALLFYWTHFVGNRTQPHILPAERCAGCQLGQKPRRYGYLAGAELTRDAPLILQLSERGLWNSDTARAFDGDLRGRTLRMWRIAKPGRQYNAPCVYHVSVEKKEESLPPAFDLASALLRLWGYSHLMRDWLKTGNPAVWSPMPMREEGINGFPGHGPPPEADPETEGL